MITANVRQVLVPCACLATELHKTESLGDPVATTRVPALLMVDAEAHDDDVLMQYPFNSHPPHRLIFEPKHVPPERCAALGSVLRGWGYECLEVLRNVSTACSCRGGASTWHKVDSNEPLDLTRPLWNETIVRAE